MIVIKNAKIETWQLTFLSFVVLFAIISVPVLYAQEPSDTGCPCDFDLAMVQDTVSLDGNYTVACLDEATFADGIGDKSHVFKYMYEIANRYRNINQPYQPKELRMQVQEMAQVCSLTIMDDDVSITSTVSDLTADQIDACSDLIRVACDSFLY